MLLPLIFIPIQVMLQCYLPKMALKIALPILRSNPALVVGMPVFRAMSRFICVTPKARFHENESPGMPVFVFLLAIRIILYRFYNKWLYAAKVGKSWQTPMLYAYKKHSEALIC